MLIKRPVASNGLQNDMEELKNLLSLFCRRVKLKGLTFSVIINILEWKNTNLVQTLPASYISEICIEIKINLKLVSAIFYFFTKWQPFKNCEKWVLFHLKSSFRSRDIQIFVFSSSHLFLPAGHCFKGWSKIILKFMTSSIV